MIYKFSVDINNKLAIEIRITKLHIYHNILIRANTALNTLSLSDAFYHFGSLGRLCPKSGISVWWINRWIGACIRFPNILKTV